MRFKHKSVYPVVEVTGLEPTTSWSLTKRATKLRYTSITKSHTALNRSANTDVNESISYYIENKNCVK